MSETPQEQDRMIRECSIDEDIPAEWAKRLLRELDAAKREVEEAKAESHRRNELNRGLGIECSRLLDAKCAAEQRASAAEAESMRWRDNCLAQERERNAAEVERDAALALLARIEKYAREDCAQTPGSTRLARALAEARALMAKEHGNE